MLDKLLKVPMCKGLSQAEGQELAAIAKESSAAQGATLFSEGDKGDAIIVVLEGQIEITKSGQSLAKIGQGSVFGEMALLGESGKRTATAIAVNDAKLLQIDAAKFQDLLKKNNLAALKVVSNLAQVMSKRLLAMNEKLTEGKQAKKEDVADFQKILNDWSF